MAATHVLAPAEAAYLASAFPQFGKVNGTAFPVEGLFFDAAADEAAFWRLDAFEYTSGNLTLVIAWYADTAGSGDVVWGASMAAITPNTDTQDVTTKSLAAEQTVTDSHLGTTNRRLHSATITISNLDSLAVGDAVWLRVRRLGSDGSDTMAGDAVLVSAVLSYS